MAAKRRSQSFDETEAFIGALEYDVGDIVFVHQKLKRFLELKSVQHAIEPRMFIPSMLGATANVMGIAKVNYLALILLKISYIGISACLHTRLGDFLKYLHSGNLT